MKGILVLRNVLTILLTVIIFAAYVAPEMPVLSGAVGVTFAATELLGRPTDTSMTINVVPSSNGQVYFEFGVVSGVYSSQTNPATLTSGTPTNVVIQGLTPNMRYYYRMVSSSDGVNWVPESSEHSFQTQRSQDTTFTFTITSDSHVNIQLGSATTWQQTMTNVANDHPDFEIDCGDTFAMDGVTTVAGAEQAYLYQRQFFDTVGSSAPVFLVVGNHEQQEAWHLNDTPSPANSPPVLGVNAEKKYYLNPVPDGFYTGNTDPYQYISGDHLREDYYAWTWGNALFVVIDPYWYTTTKPYIGNIGGGEPGPGSGNRWDWTLGLQQFNWLKQTLQNSKATYKFIFAHHMTGGSSDYGGRGGAVPANLVEWGGYNVDGTTWGWNTNRPIAQWGSEPVEQIMMDNHVTAFFHGHDHEYAYEIRDGIVYQSLPAAGFSGYGFNSYAVGVYTLKVLPSPGHLRVTVSPTQVTVDYVISAPGQSTNDQVAYSYIIAGNSGANPTPTPTATPTPTPAPTSTPTPTPTPTSTPILTPTPPTTTAPPTTNLALNKLATADSNQTSIGNTANKGNDGSKATRWSANDGGLNHWWKVDLGATHKITSTQVMFQYARNYRYKIEVSTDNIAWTVVVDQTKTTSSAQTRTDSFTAISARYIRITYTYLPFYTWASHYEFQVYGS